MSQIAEAARGPIGDQVREIVRSSNVPCICRECDPELYKIARTCEHRGRLGCIRTVHAPKGDVRVPWLSIRSYDSIYLAEQAIMYISRDGAKAYKRQIDALQRWQVLMFEGDLMDRLATRNKKNRVKISELQKVLAIYNDLYFFGALKNIRIVWSNSLSKTNRLHGFGKAHTSTTGQHSEIRINSTLHSRHFGRASNSRVLSTLLHEALHCFMDQFRLYSCKDAGCGVCNLQEDHNTPRGGHGRSWQLVARKLEEVVPHQLGFPLNLARFNGLVGDINKGRPPPSVHDMVTWGFAAPEAQTND
jgi:hypothetical protein